MASSSNPTEDRGAIRARVIRRVQADGNARVALAVYDDGGIAWCVRAGITAHEARHEVITAANRILREMEAQHGKR